jgi:uncharacterized protein YndB with AHSA1/START domain
MRRAIWSGKPGPTRRKRCDGGARRIIPPRNSKWTCGRAASGAGNCARRKTAACCRIAGVFREIVAPERLVFTFAWDEEGERGLETLVTITFAEQNGKTLMTFRQIPFQSAEERDGHRGGWTSAFDRFDEELSQPAGQS